MALWDKISSERSVEDRRGSAMGIGGIGGLGLVGTLIALAFTYLSSGGDLNAVLNQLQTTGSSASLQSSDLQYSREYPVFAGKVLGSANDYWRGYFAESGRTYRESKLVLFRGATQSGCGVATSAVGPHYCPEDQVIYLDETFFDELQTRFNAKGGDVAEAYVIAHEVGHHVQNQLGDLAAVEQASASQQNQISIATELQADCYAGVWAHSLAEQSIFEPGEISEALDAAAAVGDDRIQKATTGRIHPETWTHGSSQQRTEWFTRGYESGKPAMCSTGI